MEPRFREPGIRFCFAFVTPFCKYIRVKLCWRGYCALKMGYYLFEWCEKRMFTDKTRRWVIFMFILVTDLLLLFLSSWPSFQDLIDSVITLSSILSESWEWPEIVQLLFSRRWLFQKHKLPNILLRIHILNAYKCFWNFFGIFRSGCFEQGSCVFCGSV